MNEFDNVINNQVERELDWNDTIEKDGGEFILLPKGDYPFVVKSFERARYAGGEKLTPCNKAVLSIEIQSPDGAAVTLTHNLYLHTKTEGLISAFFAAIGQKKKGDKLQMNWNAVVGSTGKAKVDIRNWTGKDGKEYQSNEIKSFYPKEEAGSGFTPGRF